eukprot:1153481-Pelagomonas_calceolata.AAC.6
MTLPSRTDEVQGVMSQRAVPARPAFQHSSCQVTGAAVLQSSSPQYLLLEEVLYQRPDSECWKAICVSPLTCWELSASVVP